MPSFTDVPFIQVTDADVRHACGPQTFARADALEVAGHVGEPRYDVGAITGRVRGTWRRVEEVRVDTQGLRLLPACSCGAGGFCRHVGALLLHWLRHRSAFTYATALPSEEFLSSGLGERQEPVGLLGLQFLTPNAEIASLLEAVTTARLREIARQRGISLPKSRTKAEIVEVLARDLAAPAAIDAALAGLDAEELLGLDAADLCGLENALAASDDDGDFVDFDDVVDDFYGAIGGTRPTLPRQSLLDRGLLLPQTISSLRREVTRVPRAVQARLRPLNYLFARPAPVEAPDDQTSFLPAIDAHFLALARALLESEVASQLTSPTNQGYLGWEVASLRQPRPIKPWHPYLDEKGQTLLAERSGFSPQQAEFVLAMMITLGIVGHSHGLTVRVDRLRDYFARPLADRWLALGTAWLILDQWSEMLLICDATGPFEMWKRGEFYYHQIPLTSEAVAFRGFLTRLLARLGPDRWYAFDELFRMIRDLARQVDAPVFHPAPPFVSRGDHQPSWWLVERESPDQRVDLATAEGTERYYHALTSRLLTGPLRWLGVVEFSDMPLSGLSFRVRPGARSLFTGLPVDGAPLPRSELVVHEDLSIRVPTSTTDVGAGRFVAEIGDFAGISGDGLTYRVTVDRVQQLFDAGTTGPQLVQYLESHARQFPKTARALLESWWSSYGTVQLYDDLTLIELGDDYLLPELLTTSSLKKNLIHTFSPRLIALETGAVEGLRAEFERLGYGPRLVEGE